MTPPCFRKGAGLREGGDGEAGTGEHSDARDWTKGAKGGKQRQGAWPKLQDCCFGNQGTAGSCDWQPAGGGHGTGGARAGAGGGRGEGVGGVREER